MTDNIQLNPKTRFCPSPTGKVHLGNVRTALINFLYAHHFQGTFLLRIEDTDRERSKAEYTDILRADLNWLGLLWDEGPQLIGTQGDGALGPYWQSQRQDLYQQYYNKLADKKVTYPCFCSEQTLAIARKAQLAAGKPPRYNGLCRNLSAAEVAEKIASGAKPVLRFRVPDKKNITFLDLVKGKQSFASEDIGDFIVRRSNGTPPFMFCNAVDDSAMGVTHALRGEDHLTNTPRQILILQALGLSPPQYGHISLIVGADGSPLSKRHGSRDIGTLNQHGYLAIALLNYMARLGHHYVTDQEKLMSISELAANFNPNGLASSPARYDEQQLKHWQHLAVQSLTIEQLQAWSAKSCEKLAANIDRANFLTVIRNNITFPSDIDKWIDIIFNEEISFNFSNPDKEIIKTADLNFYKQAQLLIKQNPGDWQALCAGLKEACGVKGKALFQPLRLALTGTLTGPVMGPVLAIMPDNLVLKRLQQAELLC